MKHRVLSVVVITLPLLAISLAGVGPAAGAEPANALSAKEKAAGWQLLFDGKSTAAWRGYKSDKFPDKGWKVVDGLLVHEKAVKAGDIVTKDAFDTFELRFDFRLTPRANSGVKYLVDENLVKESRQGVSFEYQVLDDELHPDAKKGKDGNRRCGGLYDLLPPKEAAVKPIGEWNEARIVVETGKIEHWLNGKKVVSFTRGGPEIKAAIAESKFKEIPGFGETAKGHILLQDHNDEIAFRNIKVRKIPARAASR
jgi:Domain of Unknown Function (DUF1080)